MTIDLFDAMGQLVRSEHNIVPSAGPVRLELADLASGSYLVRVHNATAISTKALVLDNND